MKSLKELDDYAANIMSRMRDEVNVSDRIYAAAVLYGTALAEAARYDPDKAQTTLTAMREAVLLAAVVEIKKHRGEWKQ